MPRRHHASDPTRPWCDCPVDRLTGIGRVTVTIPDMDDRTDLRRIAAHLHDLAGVVAVEIDLATRAVRVDGVEDRRAVTDAIARAGFRVAPAPPLSLHETSDPAHARPDGDLP